MKPNAFRIDNIDSYPFLFEKTRDVPSGGTMIGLEGVSFTIQSSMPQMIPDARIRR
jgi:hypothetical protein